MKHKLFFLVLLLNLSCTHGHQSHQINKIRSNIKARVIIDPGHGGKDSGALGKLGLKEKDLALDISMRVKKLIKQVLPGVQVILTRNQDMFVSLEERISIANKNRGDVFVSIHINSSDNKDASGFEVYSLDIASDRHSERLAARENEGINFILADLRADSNRNFSDFLAKSIAGGLSSQFDKHKPNHNLNNRGYNQAIFQVLFVEMPAVLTELFFISNPDEERMLKSTSGRELCARGIVLGIKKYLENISQVSNAKS